MLSKAACGGLPYSVISVCAELSEDDESSATAAWKEPAKKNGLAFQLNHEQTIFAGGSVPFMGQDERSSINRALKKIQNWFRCQIIGSKNKNLFYFVLAKLHIFILTDDDIAGFCGQYNKNDYQERKHYRLNIYLKLLFKRH